MTKLLGLHISGGLSKWRQLGLQRRTVAYVTIGLIIMFSVFAYEGLQTVQRSTQMVFQERLNLAHTIAGAIDHSLDNLSADIEASLSGQAAGSSIPSLQEDAERTLVRLKSTQAGPFSMIALELRDRRGERLALAPQGYRSATYAGALTAGIGGTGEKPRLVANDLPPDSQDGVPVFLIVPLAPAEGMPLMAVAHLVGDFPNEHFAAFLRNAEDGRGDELAPESQLAGYGIELVDQSGNILLASGNTSRGHSSVHFSLLRDLLGKGQPAVAVHSPGQGAGQERHVMAAAPLDRNGLFLVLEQPRDVALALPDQLRQRIILFGAAGFLGALIGAWITAQHVARPTEQLAAAATRIGQGDLETPVNVIAQDEIGKLAEILEAMRQRLRNALQELEETNRHLEARVRERTLRLEQLMGKVISAQEEERRRLARELHDETAQSLATLSLFFGDLLEGQPDEAERAARVKEGKALADGLLEETRRLIYALRPSVLDDMGLVAALRWYAEEQLGKHGIASSAEEEGLSVRLPEYVEVALFRIAQEAMNNVVKHARATTVQLEVRKLPEAVVLTVRDDGAGFDLQAFSRTPGAHSGVGLAGMQERAVSLGGKVTVQSAPGKGTLVIARIPLI